MSAIGEYVWCPMCGGSPDDHAPGCADYVAPPPKCPKCGEAMTDVDLTPAEVETLLGVAKWDSFASCANDCCNVGGMTVFGVWDDSDKPVPVAAVDEEGELHVLEVTP